MEYKTLSRKEIEAETLAIAEIRARLAIATRELGYAPIYAAIRPEQIGNDQVYATTRLGLELKQLIDTRINTKVFLLTTEWGKANPPPRDFRITLAKAWPQGEIGLPAQHINWYRDALLHSEEKPAARPS